MISAKRVLAIIPARGGSKGLPRKNITMLGNKPLIAWSIAAARASKYIDRCIVSSDDAEIISVAQEWQGDVPFVRPAHFATDEAALEPTLIDALERLNEQFDFIVLLQPTSPFRTAEDIDRCLELCIEHRAPACVSLSAPAKSPYWMYRMEASGALQPIMAETPRHRRQDLPPIFALNGAVYVAEIDWFRRHQRFVGDETIGHVMPVDRSIDIDSEFDLRFAEAILRNQASTGTST